MPAATAAPRPEGARAVAARVLVRVADEGSFAAAALDAAIARHPGLDPRDRALATELVYGVLRSGPWLEARLARHAPRGLGSLDATTRAHLLVAAYQVSFLDRVPAFAAVSEAVSQVRATRGPKLAGFANAVLRRFAEAAAREPRVPIEEAACASASPWVREALARALGDAEAAAFLAAGPVPPPIGLRLRAGEDRDAVVAALREAAPQAGIEPGRASPRAVLVRGAGDPRRLPGWDEGRFVVQEEGSQAIALLLGAQPGERVLDACAGRGNKTSLLAEAVGAGGAVDAADLHESKLERLRVELARTGLAPRGTYPVDWSVGPGEVPEGYDRVLVDAPCTGTGTLRRRPDLATRRAPGDLATLPELQARVLATAARRARPGGAVVYAVCSVLREEAEEVLARAAALAPELAAAPFPPGPLRSRAGDATSLRLLPERDGTDGYFVASLVRR